MGFWIEEEPYSFSGFQEVADWINTPEAEKNLPLTIEVNTPWETVEELTITSIEREHMEEGDFLLECLLGEKKRPIRIWWNEEASDACVEHNGSLEEALTSFTEQWDVLSLEQRKAGGTDVYELSELGFEPAYDLATLLHVGDPDDELILHVVVYGERAEGRLREGLQAGANELPAHDANGQPLTKFVIPLMDVTEFFDLFSSLRGINSESELTLDVTILWNDIDTQAA